MDFSYFELSKAKLRKTGVVAVKEQFLNYKISENAIRKLTISINANHRQGSAFTKKRGDVRGGGRKPWRQKGTGNARQGSIRAPQWRGGGNVFGPTGEENFKHKVNRRERVTAIKSAWCKKIIAGDVRLVDILKVQKPRVVDALKLLTDLNITGDKILLVDTVIDQKLYLATRNLINVGYFSIENLSVNIILRKHFIVISRAALAILEERFNK